MERTHALSIRKKTRRFRFHAGETQQLLASFPLVEREISPEKARLTLANQEFDISKFLNKPVRAADMIKMGVREKDAANRRIKTTSCSE